MEKLKATLCCGYHSAPEYIKKFEGVLKKKILFVGQCNQLWGNPVNDKRGDKVLSFIDKNQLKVLNDGRHTRKSGTSKSVIDLTIAFISLQSILSWNAADSPFCNDHCMITVNIQSKNSEPRTTITNSTS